MATNIDENSPEYWDKFLIIPEKESEIDENSPEYWDKFLIIPDDSKVTVKPEEVTVKPEEVTAKPVVKPLDTSPVSGEDERAILERAKRLQQDTIENFQKAGGSFSDSIKEGDRIYNEVLSKAGITRKELRTPRHGEVLTDARKDPFIELRSKRIKNILEEDTIEDRARRGGVTVDEQIELDNLAVQIAAGVKRYGSDVVSAPFIIASLGLDLAKAGVRESLRLFFPEYIEKFEEADAKIKAAQKKTTSDIREFVDKKLKQAGAREGLAGAEKIVTIPKLDPGTKMVTNMAGILTGAGLARKGAKKLGRYLLPPASPGTRLARSAEMYAIMGGGAIIGDVLSRDADEQIYTEIVKLVPTADKLLATAAEDKDIELSTLESVVMQYLKQISPLIPDEVVALQKQLEINPEDSTLLKRAKQLMDAAQGGALFQPIALTLMGLFNIRAITQIAKRGSDKILRKKKAVDDGVLDPPVSTGNSTVIETEVIDSSIPIPRMISQTDELIEEPLAGVTRTLARGADDVEPSVIPKERDGIPTEAGAPSKETIPTPRIPRDEGVTRTLARGADDTDPTLTPVIKDYSQRNKISQVLISAVGKGNTLLARLLSKDGGLPSDLGEYYRRFRQGLNDASEIATTIEKPLKEITRQVKKFKGKERRLVAEKLNLYLDGKTYQGARLPSAITDVADDLMVVIEKNEGNLNRSLGLKGENRLGVVFRKDGEPYYTRTFEAQGNMDYYKRIEDFIERGRLGRAFVRTFKGQGPISSDTVVLVQDARNHFARKLEGSTSYSKLDDTQQGRIDGLILDLVESLASKGRGNLFDDIVGLSGGRSGYSGKQVSEVLKRRGELSPEVRALLGEVKDPIKRLQTTLRNQHRLLATLDWLSAVKQFVEKTSGKPFEMGGFFKFLPKDLARVTVQPSAGKGSVRTSRVNALSDYSAKYLGRFGGKGGKLLNDLFASPVFMKYLFKGVDFMGDIPGKHNLLTSYPRAINFFTGLGQATQTILDHGAYIMQLYGATGALVMNGYARHMLKDPKAFSHAFKVLKSKIRAKDKDTLSELGKLREQRVIDQNLDQANLQAMIRNAPDDIYKWYNLAGHFRTATRKLSSAYGYVDSYSKVIAHRFERQELKKIYKFKDFKNLPENKKLTVGQARKKYDDMIFFEASKTVRNTLPTYGLAAPIARALARTPFIGNYVLFPSEMVRTVHGATKKGIADALQGAAIMKNPLLGVRKRNVRQAARGLERLVGVATFLYGTDQAVKYWNEEKGITVWHGRALDLLNTGGFGAGAQRIHQEFPTQRGKNGPITGKYTTTMSLDAGDYVKRPVVMAIGSILNKDYLTATEYANNISDAAQQIILPYTGRKFLFNTFYNMALGKERRGRRPIYDPSLGPSLADWKERISKVSLEVLKTFSPDGVQKGMQWWDATDAEEYATIYEKHFAQNNIGFPVDTYDFRQWLFTGVKATTYDYGKASAFEISKDIYKIKTIQRGFYNKLSEMGQKVWEGEDDPRIKYIVDEWVRSQRRKKLVMNNMKDKIDVITEFTYKDHKGKIQTYNIGNLTADLSRAYGSLTVRPPDEDYVKAVSKVVRQSNEQKFIPDVPDETRMIKEFYRLGLFEKDSDAKVLGGNLIRRMIDAVEERVVKNQGEE